MFGKDTGVQVTSTPPSVGLALTEVGAGGAWPPKDEPAVKVQTSGPAANALPGSEWSVALIFTWISYWALAMRLADGWKMNRLPSVDHAAVPLSQGPLTARTPNPLGSAAVTRFIGSDQLTRITASSGTPLAAEAGKKESMVGAVESTSKGEESMWTAPPRLSLTSTRIIVLDELKVPGVHAIRFGLVPATNALIGWLAPPPYE